VPDPRITFGMIVLNAEPFVRYNLRALLPFAHEIIVVEGATHSARSVADETGHSKDGTLQHLREFMKTEDPDKKIRLITAEDEGRPDGFWPGEKDQMSQAYARRATGDWLWQIDADEFYHPEAMRTVLSFLQAHPETTAVNFRQIGFWGSPAIRVDSWYLYRGGHCDFQRLFRWKPGYRYTSHRPPTVVDENGRNLHTIRPVTAGQMKKRGVVLLHYLLLLPKQVEEKCAYYAAAEWAGRQGALDWAENVYRNLSDPYHVHNVYQYPGWLQRYRYEWPPQIRQMWQELFSGKLGIQVRNNTDAERLLSSPNYLAACFFLRLSAAPSAWLLRIWLWLRYYPGSLLRRLTGRNTGAK